jgi:hypothetical protein
MTKVPPLIPMQDGKGRIGTGFGGNSGGNGKEWIATENELLCRSIRCWHRVEEVLRLLRPVMMEAVAIGLPATPPAKKGRGPGRPFRKGVAANPRGHAVINDRAAALFSTIAPDFCELSATDTVLLRRACLLLARLERIHRVRDIDVALRMSGEARRLLQTLRRHHAPAPRTLSLRERLQIEAEAAAAADEVIPADAITLASDVPTAAEGHRSDEEVDT